MRRRLQMDAGVWQQMSLWDGLSSALYALSTVAFGSSSTPSVSIRCGAVSGRRAIA